MRDPEISPAANRLLSPLRREVTRGIVHTVAIGVWPQYGEDGVSWLLPAWCDCDAMERVGRIHTKSGEVVECRCAQCKTTRDYLCLKIPPPPRHARK